MRPSVLLRWKPVISCGCGSCVARLRNLWQKEKMNRIRHGVRAIGAWWCEGGNPVPVADAQRRADTCLHAEWKDAEGHHQRGCPHNSKRTLWELLERPVASAIQKLMLGKDVKVRGEDKLGTCRICLCHLPLKVHAPIAHVSNETEDDILEEFPDFCWVKKEVADFRKKLRVKP